nr:MAG TPA: hypothetical protein [Caudoviricetes sp.]
MNYGRYLICPKYKYERASIFQALKSKFCIFDQHGIVDSKKPRRSEVLYIQLFNA